MQLAQSGGLSCRTLSAISVQWFEGCLQMATSRFSEVTGETKTRTCSTLKT